jgi:hypothetical protein
MEGEFLVTMRQSEKALLRGAPRDLALLAAEVARLGRELAAAHARALELAVAEAARPLTAGEAAEALRLEEDGARMARALRALRREFEAGSPAPTDAPDTTGRDGEAAHDNGATAAAAAARVTGQTGGAWWADAPLDGTEREPERGGGLAAMTALPPAQLLALRLTARGYTTAEIAPRVGHLPGGVAILLALAASHLGAADVPGAVREAQRLGLID